MNKNDTIKTGVKTGIGFGSALAMVISYANWHSIIWAILHGLMGWFYVIYYAIRYQALNAKSSYAILSDYYSDSDLDGKSIFVVTMPGGEKRLLTVE